MIEDNGDITRGIGLITIYSAYLEGRIDDLLYQLSELEEYSEDEQKWPISRKIKKAQKILKSVKHEVADELLRILTQCKDHFEWRNELVHGRIYSPEYHQENLKSGRPNVPDRKADSAEIYLLANNLDTLNINVYRPQIFAVRRMLSEVKERNRR
jgi:hypothetical protein